jgi:hypothetical protein
LAAKYGTSGPVAFHVYDPTVPSSAEPAQ